MATIGHVTKQADGRYVGKLRTLSIQANIEIIPVLDKSSEKQPDYQVFSGTVDCGAGWNRKGKRSQKDYVSLSIAAPEFGPKTLYANLGQPVDTDDPNEFNLIWNASD